MGVMVRTYEYNFCGGSMVAYLWTPFGENVGVGSPLVHREAHDEYVRLQNVIAEPEHLRVFPLIDGANWSGQQPY